MSYYGIIKSSDTGVFGCLVTMGAASREGSKKAVGKLLSQFISCTLAQLLKLNIMWDKILKHIQDGVGTGSLFGANY